MGVSAVVGTGFGQGTPSVPGSPPQQSPPPHDTETQPARKIRNKRLRTMIGCAPVHVFLLTIVIAAPPSLFGGR